VEKVDIRPFVEELIKNNPKEVEKYRKGQKGVVGFFVGQVMRKYRGKVDPREVRKVIEDMLESV